MNLVVEYEVYTEGFWNCINANVEISEKIKKQ